MNAEPGLRIFQYNHILRKSDRMPWPGSGKRVGLELFSPSVLRVRRAGGGPEQVGADARRSRI